MTNAPLIAVQGLSVGLKTRTGAGLPILKSIDLALKSGETMGLVGESGSGKSTLALAAMAYLRPGLLRTAGQVSYKGRDLFSLPTKELERVRGGRVGLIPQNSGQSLTPSMTIGRQMLESLRLHSDLPPKDHAGRAIELLKKVRLPEPAAMMRRYPHELSGGQQQRVAIAMALSGDPEVLLLDEPTTGLDVTTQAHILTLLNEIVRSSAMAMIYVSHDLGAIAQVCDRVAVMYAGEIVLEGPTGIVLKNPPHPYARSLLAAIPRIADGRLPAALDGRPPAPGKSGAGCAFAARCPLVQPDCRSNAPTLRPAADGALVRCHHSDLALSMPVRVHRDVAKRSQVTSPALLEVEGLSVSYARPTLLEQLTGRQPRAVPNVEGISLKLAAGETLALVGESGSGKSTILKTLAGLVTARGGTMRFEGEALSPGLGRRRPDQLKRIQLIFQNPDESLNPRHTVARILGEPLRLYFGADDATARKSSAALLERVRLGPQYLDRLPGQLSGGEKQRVAIARAFAAEPTLVLCDEVTSALDVSVQAAVLDLLDDLRREKGTAYLFVSHDLAVVRALADRVAVLYQGRLCEVGPTASVYAAPCHPYTEALMACVVEPGQDRRPPVFAQDLVERSPPAVGCPFQRRCPRRLGDVCATTRPTSHGLSDGHVINCHIPPADLVRVQSTGMLDPGREHQARA